MIHSSSHPHTVPPLPYLQGRDEACLEALARWLRDEYRDKRKEEREDVLTWPRLYPQAIPRQLNGWDCGMFLIQFADHLVRPVCL